MNNKRVFGGALLKKSNPKEKRPISTKHTMHIVMRSQHAKGKRSFLAKRNREAVNRIIKHQASKHGLRLYRYENVGNHIHILLRTGHRKWLIGFLRSVTGLIARHVLGAERGSAQGLQFWEARPFSRVVTWGRDYNSVKRYFDKNRLQAWGFDLSNWSLAFDARQPDSS